MYIVLSRVVLRVFIHFNMHFYGDEDFISFSTCIHITRNRNHSRNRISCMYMFATRMIDFFYLSQRGMCVPNKRNGTYHSQRLAIQPAREFNDRAFSTMRDNRKLLIPGKWQLIAVRPAPRSRLNTKQQRDVGNENWVLTETNKNDEKCVN